MTITLVDIEASEKICDAATGGPWEARNPNTSSGNKAWLVIGAKSASGRFKIVSNLGKIGMHEGDCRLIAHARTRLPEMNKLVWEFYEMVRQYESACECAAEEIACEVCKDGRKLLERMEGGK